jgi:hypothetical protein
MVSVQTYPQAPRSKVGARSRPVSIHRSLRMVGAGEEKPSVADPAHRATQIVSNVC